MSAAGQSPVVLLLVLLLAWAATHAVTGQGYCINSRTGASSVGQQKMTVAYQAQIAAARNLGSTWRPDKNKPPGTLGCNSNGVLCGQDLESTEAATTLRIATSPAVYDTRNTSHTGGWVFAPTPSDQGDCNSCVGFALAAAAQSAAAAALRVNSNTVPLISVLQLLSCHDQVAGNCRDGWRMEQAVELLTGSAQQRSACVQGFAAEPCTGVFSRERLKTFVAARDCRVGECKVQLQRGSYSYKKEIPLENMWQIQQHIRDYGASVITRMVLPPGFKKWFDSPQRRRAVYSGPGAGTVQAEKAGDAGINHAVVLAGYNNIKEYWIIWSSWGNWADGGFARVRFGQLAIGDPDNTYGIVFNPSSPPEPRIKLTADPKSPYCQWYQVQPGDYASKVADALRLPIERLLQQNVERIPDLGAWLKPGQRLQACGASAPGKASDPLSVAPAQGVSSETSCVTKHTNEVRWTLTSSMAVPAAQTPSGKKWEYFYTYGFSQSQGEAVCVQLGGHLVTVDSNRTNQMLYDKFVAQWPLARDGIWIGLTAQQPTTDRSKWSWLSGAKMSYQNWGVCGGYPPQPDNHAGIQGQCAILSGLQWCNVGKASGTWDDYHCSYGNPFVCEFAPSVTKKTSQAQITVQVTKSATAPDGKLWVFFGLHVVQPAAQAYCQQSGGNLVTVDSANKTQFLVKNFLEPFSGIVYGVWIGLYMPATGADPTDKSQYKWYSDAPMDTYSNWGADEPSGDAKAQLGSASCGHAAPPNNGGGGLPGGSWNDVSCDRDVNPRPFICEFLQS